MSQPVLIEVCIDSVESAIASEQGGARRVELCDNLMEGGTTPSAGTIALARERIGIALNVIIRPRGGDFCYTELELEIMRRDIQMAKQLGADGVVFGMLTPDGDVDVPLTRELVALARPLSVTFHRAFDVARDPFRALEDLIAAGVDRVLTTGQEGTIIEGLDLVVELVRRANGRIIVMPGGASERQIAKVRAATGATEFHVLATRTVESEMKFRNDRVFMGGTLRPPEYGRQVIDPAAIRRLCAGAEQPHMWRGRRAALLLGLVGLLALLAVAGSAWQIGGPRLALEQARRRWAARPFNAYRVEVEERLGTDCRYVVEVRDERITSVVYNTCSQVIWWRDLPVLPVGPLFTRMANAVGTCGSGGCLCDGVVMLDAQYDPALGYPHTVSLRAEPGLRWLHPDTWRELLGPPRTCQSSLVDFELTITSLTPIP